MGKKVLIFYLSRFSGHYHAAVAIEKALLLIDDNIEVKKINAISYTNPILGNIINKAYIEVIKKKPHLWGHIYDNPNVMKKTKKAREALHKFNMSKIRKLLDAFEPDMVFCTQAFPCGMVSDYKISCAKEVPLVGVLTDHAPHSYWLHEGVDMFVVPSEESKKTFIEKGVDPENILVCGIPVDPQFKERGDADKLMADLRLDPEKPVILVMGGSQGLGAIEEAVKSLLLDKEHSYQILAVTGSNKRLYSRLVKLAKKNGTANMHVFSFVDNISELMEISDLVVTKAGGMTTAEALVKGLPMLIVDPIPGHESMNTEYLANRGAAIAIEDYDHIHEKMNNLFDSKNALRNMRGNISQIARPDSAIDIAKLIYNKK